jgi:hypothetical protein
MPLAMTQTSQPRPLNAEERSLIEFLLSVDFQGRDELLKQLDAVEVGCDCGCGSLDLKVGGPKLFSPSESPIPVEAYNDAVEVLLFVRGGLLSYLEFVFYGRYGADVASETERAAIVGPPSGQTEGTAGQSKLK